MTFEGFTASIRATEPPEGISPVLKALWYDANGDWDRAHAFAQSVETADAACVHAYLHRKEGDASNARYWYRRAGVDAFSGSLDEEWRHLVQQCVMKEKNR